MIAGGEKNMMGAQRAGRQTDRQTDTGRSCCACWCWIFSPAGVGFFSLYDGAVNWQRINRHRIISTIVFPSCIDTLVSKEEATPT